ncbi:hypothetical protein FisN_14Hh027 [Fistulifera solaris]|uniref:EF-hand domain-containing protein n=1 Tax=Fistulifera solaris TaxID=1519565 RepID=A0A1Z5K861_FISSO|nr:hypothetical protein FisN_14Hh027 [Fistulifera solaris]|eukprot:GAX22414.1 hypothetical protein FisN_14Hh027 [Fistulifera solaris]
MPRPKMYKKYNLPTAEPQMIDREFTDTELKAFRDAFRMFDLDGGGTIETHELKQVITQLGDNPTDEEIDDMIIAVDTNGDGEIDFEEFLALMRLRMGESGDDAETHLREVFDMFDADGSGCIDRNEMRTLMKKLAQDLTEEEITLIMDEVDTDGDGEISFEEFKMLVIK